MTTTIPNLEKIDVDELIAAVHDSMYGLDNPGFCTECGVYVDGVEPDARCYICDQCGQPGVYGAQELLLYLP